MRKLLPRLVDLSLTVAWFLVVALLPITSMPWVARLIRSDMVAAPSALPLVWMVLVFLLPYLLWRRGSIPRAALPILVFALIALISSALALFRNVPYYKGYSLLSREGRALLTLAIGLAFYLVTATWPRTTHRLRWTFHALNLSGLLIIAWSAVQAYLYFTQGGYPYDLNEFQQIFSQRGFYPQRVTGWALEPSWLAHQLNLVYLPFWLAIFWQRYTAYRLRLWFIHVEDLLLLGGVATLLLSFSRVGWMAFGLSVVFLVIRATTALARRAQTWIGSRWPAPPSRQRLVRALTFATLLIVVLGAYAFSAYQVVRLASNYDKRVANLFNQPVAQIFTFKYANQLAFAERAVYWAAGWRIFNDYPLLGVGVGNAGFYFPAYLPAYAWALPEIKLVVYHSTVVPNTKSLWSRLLAETGLVGFSCFAAWLFVIWQSAAALRRAAHPIHRVVGLAGGLALTALLIEGFSVDSFALPYLWITTGLVSAATLGLRAGSESNQPVQ